MQFIYQSNVTPFHQQLFPKTLFEDMKDEIANEFIDKLPLGPHGADIILPKKN